MPRTIDPGTRPYPRYSMRNPPNRLSVTPSRSKNNSLIMTINSLPHRGPAPSAALVELGYLDEFRVGTLPCIKAILGYCA